MKESASSFNRPNAMPSLADAVSRRTFLVASGAAMGGMALGQPASAAKVGAGKSQGGGTAKSTILFFLCGGASHIDMWDLKPEAPAEYRGPFQQIETSAPGVRISEHLPMTAKQAHHLALLRSIRGSVTTNDHHAGYYYNLTGHFPDPTFVSQGNDRRPYSDDWPYMGCVVGSKLPPRRDLPNAVTLPHKPSRAPYTRPGQFAARLGIEHDPLYVYSTHEKPLEFTAPALVLQGDVTAERLANRRELMTTLDEARREFDEIAGVRRWSTLQERAVSLLNSARTTTAFDIASEPASVRERYGQNANGMSLLMARRLVEAGVPFITVFWLEDNRLHEKCKSAGGWDTHGNNFNCLKENLLPPFDRGFSALVEDLAQRGLLDETLLLITSEMGRMPKIGDRRSGGVAGAGRDHWTHCLTDVMGGGGIRGGQVYGSSDRLGEYPADMQITPAHVAKTVFHAMGVHDLETRDKDGRVFNLLAEGEPLVSLF